MSARYQHVPLFLCLALIALAGCAREPNALIRVGTIVWPGYEPFFLGREKEYFKGIPVKLVEYTSNGDVLRAFQNGALEAAALTADEVLRLSETEPNLRAIAILDVSHGADALLVREDIKSLQELKGRSVGVEVNSTGIYLLSRVLEAAGLERQDVRVVFMENERHESAFREGEVDAVVTFEPYRNRLIQVGAVNLFDSSKIPHEIMDVLVVRQQLIQQRPEALRGLLEGWFKAGEYLNQHPLKAAEIMGAREGLSGEQFLKSLALVRIPSREENKRLLDPTNEKVMQVLRKIAKNMVGAGFLTNSVAPEQLVTNELL